VTYFLHIPIQLLFEIVLDIINIDRAVLKLRVERREGLLLSFFSLFLTDHDKNWDVPTKFTGINIKCLEMYSMFIVLQPAYRRTDETLLLACSAGMRTSLNDLTVSSIVFSSFYIVYPSKFMWLHN
jgi:hypothetical protein